MVRMMIVIGALLVLSGIAAAQETGGGGADEGEKKFAVITLSKLEPYEAARLINELEPRARAQVSESIGGLVLCGQAETIAQVEEMIRVLESKMPTGSERRTEVLRIRNRRVEDIADQLRMTLGDECRLAGDDTTGQLIVHGSGRTVDRVRELVAQLDQPQETISLMFDYLRVQPASGKPQTAVKSLPHRLDGVDVALAKNGFEIVDLLGHTLVHCADGEDFNMESSEGGDGSRMQYRIEGHTHLLADSDRLRITVQTWVDREFSSGPEGVQQEREFRAETRLVTGFDEAVVLAALPSSEGNEKGSLVMVVRASRQPKR